MTTPAADSTDTAITDPQTTDQTDAATTTTADAAQDAESGNSEAARYRRRLRDAEAERDGLAARVDTYRRADAERAAAKLLATPADLWLFHQPADVLNDDGDVDEDLVRQLAAEVLEQRPGLAAPNAALDMGQGRRGAAPNSDGGWSGVLQSSQGTGRRSTVGRI